jgi:hypothetical protein
VQGFDSFSPWGLAFDHTAIHVGFSKEKVALGQIFSMLWFPFSLNIPSVLRIY